jgi:hypothetical protein
VEMTIAEKTFMTVLGQRRVDEIIDSLGEAKDCECEPFHHG